jgi:hypothetical protein
MARYIDAEKLCEALKSMASTQYPDKQNTILGVVSSIENFPTADVTPRAEAEKWFRECEELQGRMIELEREVAREVMKEVRKTLLNMVLANAMGETYDVEGRLAEIEQKYTEGER